jgi:hypothetical protein
MPILAHSEGAEDDLSTGKFFFRESCTMRCEKAVRMHYFCGSDADELYSYFARKSCFRQSSRAPIQNIRIQERRFHAEAHISTQPTQPFEDARLSQPHEDQKRRSGFVAAARQGPQACFRQRRLSRLDFPQDSPLSGAAYCCPSLKRNGMEICRSQGSTGGAPVCGSMRTTSVFTTRAEGLRLLR